MPKLINWIPQRVCDGVFGLHLELLPQRHAVQVLQSVHAELHRDNGAEGLSGTGGPTVVAVYEVALLSGEGTGGGREGGEGRREKVACALYN